MSSAALAKEHGDEEESTRCFIDDGNQSGRATYPLDMNHAVAWHTWPYRVMIGCRARNLPDVLDKATLG